MKKQSTPEVFSSIESEIEVDFPTLDETQVKLDNFPDGLEIAKPTDLSAVRARRNAHDGALDKYQARAILGAFKKPS